MFGKKKNTVSVCDVCVYLYTDWGSDIKHFFKASQPKKTQSGAAAENVPLSDRLKSFVIYVPSLASRLKKIQLLVFAFRQMKQKVDSSDRCSPWN